MKQPNIKLARRCMWVIIIGLVLSGVTAFPLETELAWLTQHSSGLPLTMQNWLLQIYHELKDVNARYPHLAYGTDWLAFAHLVIAVVFIGPLRDPVKNVWVIEFGMIACVGVIPLALIAGPVRQIPFFWQMIDCSFGVIGIIPLIIAYRAVGGRSADGYQ